MKKFYAVIGNPPYQDQAVGEQKTFQKPIYNDFLDSAYQLADRVEMIHPARFLFNAGSTPKPWNRKMLSDPHIKVLSYAADSRTVFRDQEIKGGVAITLRDANRDIGPIEVFTPYPELESIMGKVVGSADYKSFASIVVTRTAYRLTQKMHEDYPEAAEQLSSGHLYDMSTNIFERLPQVFLSQKPKDEYDYVRILGRVGTSRVFKWIRRDYVTSVPNLDAYKLFMPSGSGDGKYGEILSTPILGEPGEGATETFISIGKFQTSEEAEAAAKYVSSKFSRALLGILKSTQHLTPATWEYVPMQDFTSDSDIDWSQSVADIDQQLYKKYGLDKEEIEFIETHVKAMD